jgi:hypothetical protein
MGKNGKAWLESNKEQRLELAEYNYPLWHQYLMEILWTVDLIYGAIAYRISLLSKR